MIAISRRQPTLTDEQAELVARILCFAERPHFGVRVPGEFRLGGLAGCGKTTTLAAVIRELEALGLSVATAAPTGKAALCLRRKGIRSATTLHRLLYKPTTIEADHPKHGRVIVSVVYTPIPPGQLHYDFICVDEASMIDADLYALLRSHNIPILFVGDFGQLPPVGRDIGLLLERDGTLETIHRQAAGSAIVQAAHKVRTGAKLSAADVRPRELSIERYVDGPLDDIDIVIVARNETRRRYNAVRRAQDGFEGRVVVGERVICLQNAHASGILNGQLFTVLEIGDERKGVCPVELLDDLGDTYSAPMWMAGFDEPNTKMHIPHGVRFDFGHALTCHKSQGSEWASVAVIDEITDWHERNGYFDGPRWRYTAITRASDRLRYFRP